MEKRADKYGAYFLILFRPETELYKKNQKHDYKYNWEEFVRYDAELKAGRFIDNMRRRTMQGYMHGWRTNSRDRSMLSEYRARSRDEWTAEEKNEARDIFGKKSGTKKDYYDEDDEGMPDMSTFELSHREALGIVKNVAFSDNLVWALPMQQTPLTKIQEQHRETQTNKQASPWRQVP